MSPTLALLLVALAIAVAWSLKHGGLLPRRYRDRSCQSREWKKAFPTASAAEIRAFLSVFVSAFAFKDDEKLKLQPQDTIMQIYRALYPSKWQADALEVETLAIDLRKHYGLELSSIWSPELTLGQVFEHAKLTRATAHPVTPNPSLNPRLRSRG